jgi:hypothetical protein
VRSFVLLAAILLSTAARAQVAGTVKPEPEPYELKGNRLGMSLSDFKTRYFHVPTGDTRPGPFCSDAYPDGFSRRTKLHDTAALDAVKADTAAGLVTCKIFFPYEEMEGPKSTVANVPVVLLFDFVDGKLYRIGASFRQEVFDRVRAAFTEKYGEPNLAETKTYQNAFGATFAGQIILWSNGLSSIQLTERGIDLNTSTLTFLHTSLAKEAEARKPKPKPDL